MDQISSIIPMIILSIIILFFLVIVLIIYLLYLNKKPNQYSEVEDNKEANNPIQNK